LPNTKKKWSPKLSDAEFLPRTKVTLAEIYRRCPVVPLALLHGTDTPIEFHGFKLENDTIIVPNIWAAHHDPKIFPLPFDFNPNRPNLISSDQTLPFGVGLRRCPGESLARQEIFLLFVGILKEFWIEPGSDRNELLRCLSNPEGGFFLKPPPHRLIFRRRKLATIRTQEVLPFLADYGRVL